MAFIRHHGFPSRPVLLRDLLGTFAGREQQPRRIQDSLGLDPWLRFVLIGDSADKGPEIYPAFARTNLRRILAISIREVRRDLGDSQVQEVSDA